MRILGIDPGIGRTGWGIIDHQKGQVSTSGYGCLETAQKLPLEKRLQELYDKLQAIIVKEKPEALAIEELFFNTNVSTALTVGQARGVVLLLAAQHTLAFAEYTPPQVKMALTGYGRADKNQVGQMVKTILKLPTIPKPDDTADALAIGITHAFSLKIKRLPR